MSGWSRSTTKDLENRKSQSSDARQKMLSYFEGVSPPSVTMKTYSTGPLGAVGSTGTYRTKEQQEKVYDSYTSYNTRPTPQELAFSHVQEEVRRVVNEETFGLRADNADLQKSVKELQEKIKDMIDMMDEMERVFYGD